MASAVRLQLVNRLGSARGGVELCLQSPALQAQEQRRQEHIDVVEGRCSHQVSAWLDLLAPGWGLVWETISPSHQSVLLGGRAVRAVEELQRPNWNSRHVGQ